MRTSSLYHWGVGSRGSVSSVPPPRLPASCCGVRGWGAGTGEQERVCLTPHVCSVRQPCVVLLTELSVPLTL